MKISACLIVYNEERYIARALCSIKDTVDEIILVHDGECLDKTLEIAQSFGVKIFRRPHFGFMEAHFPFCLTQATGEWILRIDADEYLSNELKNNLRKLCEEKNVDAYEFLWPIYNGQRYTTNKWPHKMCLFKKNRVSFLGIVHYAPFIDGICIRSGHKLMHEPNYDNFSWKVFKDKWVKWARAQSLNYFLDFNQVSRFNYYDKDWPKKIKLRKKFPLTLIPVEFFLTFFKTLSDGAYKELIGFKASLMGACYRVMVNYYIFLRKKEK